MLEQCETDVLILASTLLPPRTTCVISNVMLPQNCTLEPFSLVYFLLLLDN